MRATERSMAPRVAAWEVGRARGWLRSASTSTVSGRTMAAATSSTTPRQRRRPKSRIIGTGDRCSAAKPKPAATIATVRGPAMLVIAVVAASVLGACAGFLWWNAAPARIFMGDTGSLALGGGLGGLALLTRTQLLLPIIGGLFVLETVSVVIQVISFRGFKRRVFRMAPIHHHFELAGWPEFTVIVRFWLIAGLFVAFGLGLFYADFIRIPGALD